MARLGKTGPVSLVSLLLEQIAKLEHAASRESVYNASHCYSCFATASLDALST